MTQSSMIPPGVHRPWTERDLDASDEECHHEVARPGETWTTEYPFAVDVDPGKVGR